MQMDTTFDNSNIIFNVKEENSFKDITIYDAQTEIVSTPEMKLSICPRNNDSTINEEIDFNVKQEDSSNPETKLNEIVAGQLIQPHKSFVY
jgi:hypothetical protein